MHGGLERRSTWFKEVEEKIKSLGQLVLLALQINSDLMLGPNIALWYSHFDASAW